MRSTVMPIVAVLRLFIALVFTEPRTCSCVRLKTEAQFVGASCPNIVAPQVFCKPFHPQYRETVEHRTTHPETDYRMSTAPHLPYKAAVKNRWMRVRGALDLSRAACIGIST